MQKYSDIVQGQNGAVVPNASVLITTSPGGATASLFSDSAGTVPKANPLTSDAFGRISCYAADGRYSRATSGTGIVGTITETDCILLEDPADATALNGTSLTVSGNTILGDASTDTLNVGNGGIIKDASGNVGIGGTPGVKFDIVNTGNTVARVIATAGIPRFDLHYSGIGRFSASVQPDASYLLFDETSGVSASRYLSGASGYWKFYANGTQAMTLDASGNLGIGVTPTAGINASLQIKDGIKFPATQVPSTDPNTFDDYEEGDWTPNQGAGLTVVGAFSSSGKYTKKGREVTVTGTINGATSIAVSPGGTITSNLPFSSAIIAVGAMISGTLTQSGIVAASASALGSGSTITATPQITFTVTYFV